MNKSDLFLKVQKRIAEVRERYETSQSRFFNILVMGDSGTGKTSLLRTCPKPLLIDSFDPGGTKAQLLQEDIKKGDIIVDSRWEEDSWKKPQAFRAWEREFLERRSMDFFSCIGTYAIDSLTRWSESLIYAILQAGSKTGGPRTGQTPELQDYMVQQLTAVDYISLIMALPCNVLITGHLDYQKDEVTGKMETGLLLPGKLANKLPQLFDEVLLARTKETRSPNGTTINYMLQTQNDGYYKAKSRIGGTKLDLFEEPDIEKLMQKAGYEVSDLEGFFDPSEETS